MAEQGFTCRPLLLPHGSGERIEKQPPECESFTLLRGHGGPEGLGDLSKSLPASVGVWVGGGAGCYPHTWGPCVSSQVIGTLPWVVNSASVAAPAPAQSLQVQAVTPQLLLNAQGQVIATLASSPLPPPVAVRKPSTPESPAKSEVQGLGWGRVAGSAVRHEQPPSRGWAGQHDFPKPLGKQDTSQKWREAEGRRSLWFTCALPRKTPPPPRSLPPHTKRVYMCPQRPVPL